MQTRRTMLLLTAGAMLAGCGPKTPWHATDVTGRMPDLQFKMVRASDGQTVSAEDYRGRAVLLYFGYTNCPDICPTTLSHLYDVLQQMGDQAERVRVLFVTVDPDRDTLDVLKPFTHAFGDQVDGLHGNAKQIAALAQRYQIQYAVTKTPKYTVVHESKVLVFDDRGRARLVIPDSADTVGIADDLRRIAAGE